MSTYSLNNYSISKALLWGNCAGHCKKSKAGSLGERTVHLIIAGVECLPIIGQIASLFELIISQLNKPEIKDVPYLQTIFTSKTISQFFDDLNSKFSWYDLKWTVEVSDLVKDQADIDFENRVIRLKPALPDIAKVTFFVFELANASQENRFREWSTKALWEGQDEEEFAKGIERIEFDSCVIHHDLILKIISEMNWTSQLDIYKDMIEDGFEAYWEKVKNTPHAESYRSFFKAQTTRKWIVSNLFC